MAFKKVHLIVNPAAGQPKPILRIVNDVLHKHDVDWNVSVTQKDGSGARLAQEAVQAGADLIAVYGGDGTVKDVINGLMDGGVPLAYLPGGTGNALAHELNIPMDLEKAVSLIIEGHTLRGIDVGKTVRESQPDQPGYFILRANVGLQTNIVQSATREEKDRFGNLAYLIAGLKSLADSNSKPESFHITVDGEEIEAQGLTCMVANSASVGGPSSFRFAADVDPSDGILNVFVFDASFGSILEALSSAMNSERSSFSQHWQGREITVRDQRAVVLDGEDFGHAPIAVTVVPQAVRILVPGGNS
jgi:YegS/Rv2252/BmrU family lipid kinase